MTKILSLASLKQPQGFSVVGLDGSSFGYSVSRAGDINGDGFDDVVIGTPYLSYSNSYTNNGLACVIYGSNNSFSSMEISHISSLEGFCTTNTVGNSWTGYSVSDAGDVNNDGMDDVIIGSSTDFLGYVIYGGNKFSNSLNVQSLPSEQGFTIKGLGGAQAGYCVSGVGDVNNDGCDDFAIGFYDTSFNYGSGTMYVVYGQSSFVSPLNLQSLAGTRGFNITGTPNSYSGYSISGAGDVNNDGYGDIIIGAPTAPSSSRTGMAYVIYGGSDLTNVDLANLDVTEGFSISNYLGGAWFGLSVSGAGDINHDGYDDIICWCTVSRNKWKA